MNLQRKIPKASFLCSLVCLLCVLLCSCGKDSQRERMFSKQPSDGSGKEAAGQDSSPASEAASEISESPSEAGQPEPEETALSPITLSFTGDVYLSDTLVNAYRQQGNTAIADDKVLSALADSDITMINHEYACTSETQKVDYQIYNFRSAPEHEYILKELGVDIAGLSNNHILDYGLAGMQETLQTLRGLGIDCVGAGSNIEEAKQAVIREIKGRKIAFVAASHFVPDVSWHASDAAPGILTTYEGTDNYKALMEYISYLKQVENADFVIISAHFGIEKQNEFVPYQQQLSHAWIDAGADLIVGSHAHVLQGMECYKGKYIIYNLGNFLFGNYEKETALLQVEIDKDNQIAARILPCVTKAFYVRSMNDQEAEVLYRFLESVSVNVQLDTQGWIRQNDYDGTH